MDHFKYNVEKHSVDYAKAKLLAFNGNYTSIEYYITF